MIYHLLALLILGSFTASAHSNYHEEEEFNRLMAHRDERFEREYDGEDTMDGKLIHLLLQLRRLEEQKPAEAVNLAEEELNDDSFLPFALLARQSGRHRRSAFEKCENGQLRGHFNPRRYMRCEHGRWIVDNCPAGTEFDFVRKEFVALGTNYVY